MKEVGTSPRSSRLSAGSNSFEPVRHLIHLRALQHIMHAQGVRRATQIPTSCRRRRYLRQRLRHAHIARLEFPPALRRKKITLNVDKWKCALSAVTFAGLSLSPEGCHVDPLIIQAIADFSTPANRDRHHSYTAIPPMPTPPHQERVRLVGRFRACLQSC